MLTNRGTPFNEHGWGLLLDDLHRLFLMSDGQVNDLNGGTASTSQSQNSSEQTGLVVNLGNNISINVNNSLPVGYAGGNLTLQEITVCVDGVQKKMVVLASNPY